MASITMEAFSLAPPTTRNVSRLSEAAISSFTYPTLSFRQGRLASSQIRCSNAYQSMKKVNVKDFGSIEETVGSLTDVEGLRFGLVVGRFNEFISKALLSGALETFRRYQIKDEDMEVVWVPGSFEIPIVAQTLAKSGKFDAILCIGVVIRGDTTHYDAVANTAASGVLSAGLNSGVPCIFGVLTCENLDQAINRAGGKAGNKGSEAAVTAIEMATLFKHHFKKIASK